MDGGELHTVTMRGSIVLTLELCHNEALEYCNGQHCALRAIDLLLMEVLTLIQNLCIRLALP